MCLCFDCRVRNRVIYQSPSDIILCRGDTEQGTQQENSYTKHAVTNILPVTATLGRVNKASHWNVIGRGIKSITQQVFLTMFIRG